MHSREAGLACSRQGFWHSPWPVSESALYPDTIRVSINTRIRDQYFMSSFKNVTVERHANVYFDGKVTSHTILFPTGERKTLGVMLPGEYRFGTGKKELMEIQAGEVQILLPGESTWRTVGAGDSFEVAGDSAFDIRVAKITDYCCSYLD